MRGTVPKGRSCLFLSVSKQAVVRYLGRPLRPDDLMLAGPGSRVDLYVPGGAALFIFAFESSDGISHRGLRIYESTDTSAADVAGLVHHIKQAEQHDSGSAEALTKHLRRAITSARVLPHDRAASAPRVSAVVSACRLVEKRFPAPITLNELSRHCGVAQRTLEYGFRQVYGTTPLTFIRSLRLTRSRAALLRAAAYTSISEAARACGFTHMGQYSRDYRRFFGETPSMTRARGQSFRYST